MQTAGAIGSVPERGRRRWGVIVTGIVVAVVGLLCVVGGAAASGLEQVRSSSAPIAESRTPTPLRFDAEDATYRVAIDADHESRTDVIASSTRCAVELADGSVVDLTGNVQAVGEMTGTIGSVGSFDAVAGTTTITCTARDDGVRYFVDDESALQRYGVVAMIAGAVILVIATALILLGVFTHRSR